MKIHITTTHPGRVTSVTHTPGTLADHCNDVITRKRLDHDWVLPEEAFEYYSTHLLKPNETITRFTTKPE